MRDEESGTVLSRSHSHVYAHLYEPPIHSNIFRIGKVGITTFLVRES